MSVEADFGISEWVAQQSGTELDWELGWNGVLEYTRFAGVSFQGDFGGTQLTRVSEWFSTDGKSLTVGERIRAHSWLGQGALVAFRFSVVVIPNH
jgi:hypothetical protein